jgi:SPP1 family predicted phage head-tail adaptor
LSATVVADNIGNQTEVLGERKVYANEYSVSSGEFYNAAVTGLKPAKAFEIYSFEYNNEDKLKHDGSIYRIIRTQGKGEKVVLTCEKVAADG